MFQHNPTHPGSFIKRVYLEPQSLSIREVASKLHVNPSTLGRLMNGKLRVSAVMALKLSKVLGRSPESWLAMQRNFDLEKAKSKIDLSSYVSIKL